MYNEKCQNQLVKMLNQSAKVTYHAINIHLPNKVVYPYPLLTTFYLHNMNINIY